MENFLNFFCKNFEVFGCAPEAWKIFCGQKIFHPPREVSGPDHTLPPGGQILGGWVGGRPPPPGVLKKPLDSEQMVLCGKAPMFPPPQEVSGTFFLPSSEL